MAATLPPARPEPPSRVPKLREAPKRAARRPLPPKATAALTAGIFVALFAAGALYTGLTRQESAYDLALEAERRGDEAALLANLLLAVAKDPAHLPAQKALAAVYLKKGALDDAALAFRTALKYAPEDPELRVGLAELHLARNEEYKALSELESLSAVRPGDLGLQLRIGRIYESRRTWEKVVRCAQAALAVAADDAEALRLLAAGLAGRGERKEALDAARRAVASHGATHAARALLSRLLLAAGDMDGAEAEARAAVGSAFGDPDAHFALGAALEKKGQVDGAIREWKIAVERREGFAEGHLRLAAAYAGRGITDRALESYALALRHGERDRDIASAAKAGIRAIKDAGRPR